jgi:DNA repair protein RecN (Recombination protein N)
MLAQLTIRNFALIDSVNLEFQPGFNVLTGETGAGKSILIDAITAALGARAGAELVRVGADRASVEAVFEVGDYSLPTVQEWAEDGVIILAREIAASGRSTFRINGRMCTASTVREVAADLIDIHGQHDHQSLLSPDRHVDFLDAWAGKELGALRRQAQELYTALRSTRRELDEILINERERAQQLDLYHFQVEEIDAAALQPNEEEELLADRSRLANAEKLFASGSAAREALAGGEVSAADLLRTAARELESIRALDSQVEPLCELLETAIASAEEAFSQLRGYLETIEFNPERLEQVQERLALIASLKRKYGDTIPEILQYRELVATKVDDLSHSEERRTKLEADFARLASELDAAAQRLHTARKRAAEDFEREIAGHLADLNMSGTRFAVRLDPPAPAAEAWDRGLSAIQGKAEFLISANPGEPLRPLARIASGGEMSRVMLALKTAMAGSHPVALIFDEIDTGVGGKTAEALGAKMAELSASNQVLCVTHLPQIASMAGRHLQVSKSVVSDRTLVEVRILDGDARVGELARMLGGSEATAAQHARELLAAAPPRLRTGEPGAAT